jgi:hypothetical protein
MPLAVDILDLAPRSRGAGRRARGHQPAGVYAQLVAAHVGKRGAARAVFEAHAGTVEAQIEVAAGRVADLDRQVAQADATQPCTIATVARAADLNRLRSMKPLG